MIKQNRTVELKNITLPVRVSHGNLNPSQRIDDISNRIDSLQIDIIVNYDINVPLQDFSLDGVWNYGDVYHYLCLSDVPTITGPLESILDEAILLIEKTAKEQNIKLNYTEVSANRLGLAVGYPHLVTRRNYEPVINSTSPMQRSAGICDFPLIISVNHSWCKGSQKVEHVDLRHECINLSFHAETVSQELSSNDLTGLYNYAGLIHQVQNKQGFEVNGPVEQLCDLISEILENDAKKLNVKLLKTIVKVERTGYARCTPILTLTRYF